MTRILSKDQIASLEKIRENLRSRAKAVTKTNVIKKKHIPLPVGLYDAISQGAKAGNATVKDLKEQESVYFGVDFAVKNRLAGVVSVPSRPFLGKAFSEAIKNPDFRLALERAVYSPEISPYWTIDEGEVILTKEFLALLERRLREKMEQRNIYERGKLAAEYEAEPLPLHAVPWAVIAVFWLFYLMR